MIFCYFHFSVFFLFFFLYFFSSRPYMSDIKFWRRQIPYVVGYDHSLNFLLLQDIRYRLTTRVEGMDDEEPDDSIYNAIYSELKLPLQDGDYPSTQLWMQCLEAVGLICFLNPNTAAIE